MLAGMIALGGAASATTITVTPSTPSVLEGQQVVVEVVASDLEYGWYPTIDAFHFDLIYDPALMSVSSVSFSDELTAFGFSSLDFVDLETPGIAEVASYSLVPFSYLNLTQSETFSLATFVFDTLDVGIVDLMLTSYAFYDDEWRQMHVEVLNGSVGIEGEVLANPVPGALPLLLTGLAGLHFARRRKQQTAA